MPLFTHSLMKLMRAAHRPTRPPAPSHRQSPCARARCLAPWQSDAQEEIEAITNQISDLRIALLALGGFVYWDANWELCGVSALTIGKGLYFDAPKPLSRIAGGAGDLLRSTLYDTDRIERVTIQPMVELGVSGFCWLIPKEPFPGQETSRDHPWPDGAFAYFFDEWISWSTLRNTCLQPLPG